LRSITTPFLKECPAARLAGYGTNGVPDPPCISPIRLAYPRRRYPDMAVVAREKIQAVFERFALLRTADDTFCLRSSSLNLVNGTVGLTFSCDGAHYLPAEEFLARDEGFWLGG
jgi:hypothetical protein